MPRSISSDPSILLDGLNAAQKEAVTHAEGPLLILAGAGTGKTRVLTHRLSYLLAAHKEVKPEQILALTYTRKAAEEMRIRAEALLPGLTHFPKIATFHSFAHELVSEHSVDIGFSPRIQLLAESLERASVLHSLVFRLPIEFLPGKEKREDLIEPVLQFIERAKDELLTPEEIEQYFLGEKNKLGQIPNDERAEREGEIAQGLELAGLYRAYEDALRKADALDYGGLIFLFARILREKPAVRKKISGLYRYILVDEFQDTNIAQIELLRLLAQNHGNLCVVGDDDQAIYRFRGASYASFKKFREYFPNTRVIKLKKNYRSTKNILSAAEAVIRVNGEDRYEASKELITESAPGEPVELHYFSDYGEEAAWIASRIRELAGQNPGPAGEIFSQIAVLVRSKSTAETIKLALAKKGIPYEEATGGALLAEAEVKDALAILKIAAEVDEENSLFRVLISPLVGLASAEYRTISEWAKKEKDHDSGLACHLHEFSSISSLSGEARQKLSAFSKKIEGLKKLSSRAPAGEVFWKAAAEFKLFSLYFYKGSGEARAAIRHLAALYDFILRFDEAEKQGPTLKKLMHLVVLAEKLEIGPQIQSEIQSENAAVRLATVHAAKGLEFPIVFIPSVNSKKFPTRSQKEVFPIPDALLKEALPQGEFHTQEERRLFYVAVTRAREKIYLSCVEKKHTPPSVFIKELLASDAHDLIQAIRHPAKEEKKAGHEERVHRLFDREPAVSLELLELLEKKTGDVQAELAALLQEFFRLRAFDAQKADALVNNLRLPELAAIGSNRPSEKPLDSSPGKNKMAEIPPSTELIVLSPSKVEDYNWCPLKYQLKYELGIPTPPAPFLKFGACVHKALECFYRDLEAGRAASLENLLRRYEENWERRGYRSKTEEASYKSRGENMLRRYFERCQDDITNESLALEKKFAISFSPHVEVHGKTDRIQRLKNGEVEIIDYKTGKPKNQEKVDENIQLSIYALAFQESFGRLPDRMTFHYVDAEEKVSTVMTGEKITQTCQKILELSEKIRKKEFPPCSPQQQYVRCGYCEYKPICPVHEK
ncbi:MAG: ATP-dependent helicase [Candidatus Omnitrophica bacterium]|nr:ATP-dependent helicase [Candidatus Omnitrophota bacterium]